jgi:hypothetical protein
VKGIDLTTGGSFQKREAAASRAITMSAADAERDSADLKLLIPINSRQVATHDMARASL